MCVKHYSFYSFALLLWSTVAYPVPTGFMALHSHAVCHIAITLHMDLLSHILGCNNLPFLVINTLDWGTGLFLYRNTSTA